MHLCPSHSPRKWGAILTILTIPRVSRVVLSAIIFGGLYFLNSWDFPTYFLLLTVCVLLSLHVNERMAAVGKTRSFA